MKAKPTNHFYVIFLLLSVAVVFIAATKAGASIGVVMQALSFATAVALVIGGAYAVLHWVRPKWLLKLSSFSEDQGKGGGLFAGIGSLLIALAVSKWAFALLECLVICNAYGHEAWASGLRVIDKWGGLSDGDYLTGWSSITLFMGTFVLTAPLTIGSFLLFRYIGFRIRGRRWSDHADS